MRSTHFGRAGTDAWRPWKQRVVAVLLLAVALFLVIDPLWECRDHLDDLRHLAGPHGVLLILLLVACAGISLLKSVRGLGLLLLSVVAGMAHPFVMLRRASQGASIPAFFGPPPPLRI